MKKIGFIGTGWVGKNLSDDFEKRGFTVVRYSLEKKYFKNKDLIKDCDIVFICVPTPTTPKGFDASAVKQTIKLVGKGKIAVIKSTILPHTTESLQKENPDIFIMHSPEFLTIKNAKYEASHPDRNIIGIPKMNKVYQKKAGEIIKLMPKAQFNLICSSREAEVIKYSNNCWFFIKVVYANLIYSLTEDLGCDWSKVKQAMVADPRIGHSHIDPYHNNGRGAGGYCLLKDFAAFTRFYNKQTKDGLGTSMLKAAERKNLELLVKTNKDIDLILGVYNKLVKD